MLRTTVLSLLISSVVFGQVQRRNAPVRSGPPPVLGAPTSKPALATRPAVATRPASQDRTLTAEEKAQYAAALATDRSSRLAMAEDARREIRLTLTQLQKDHDEQFSSNLKTMQKAENDRDRARARRRSPYRHDSDAVASANDRIETEHDTTTSNKAIVSALMKKLDALENCHRAVLDVETQLKFDQLQKAGVAQKRAQNEMKRADSIRISGLSFNGASGQGWQLFSSSLRKVEEVTSTVKGEFGRMPDVPDSLTPNGQPNLANGVAAAALIGTSNQVTIGMKRADVQQFMGPPSRSVGLKWYYGKDFGPMKVITFDGTGRVASIEER